MPQLEKIVKISFTKRRSNTVKKSIKTIGIIAAMGIMLVLAFGLGTTQAKTITEVQTVTETRDVILIYL